MIFDPPLLAGAVHVTASWALPLVATTDVGASGTVAAGVTGVELADGGLMPTAFLAITLITYAVPLVRPVTVHDVVVIGEPDLYRVHDPAAPLLLEYFTRYSVIFEPRDRDPLALRAVRQPSNACGSVVDRAIPDRPEK